MATRVTPAAARIVHLRDTLGLDGALAERTGLAWGVYQAFLRELEHSPLPKAVNKFDNLPKGERRRLEALADPTYAALSASPACADLLPERTG